MNRKQKVKYIEEFLAKKEERTIENRNGAKILLRFEHGMLVAYDPVMVFDYTANPIAEQPDDIVDQAYELISNTK